MKKTFNFPGDAWDGIREAFCENVYEEVVRNPKFTGEDDEPQLIPNPLTRDEFAEQEVLKLIAERARDWMERAREAPIKAQIKQDVNERIQAVIANTTITTE